MDWIGCNLVECVPGKVSGRPVVRDTRILADTIVEDYQSGMTREEIQENYPALSLNQIAALVAFASTKQPAA